jgi:ankyrin repeat protein
VKTPVSCWSSCLQKSAGERSCGGQQKQRNEKSCGRSTPVGCSRQCTKHARSQNGGRLNALVEWFSLPSARFCFFLFPQVSRAFLAKWAKQKCCAVGAGPRALRPRRCLLLQWDHGTEYQKYHLMLLLNKLARAAASGDDEEVVRLLAAGQSPSDTGIMTGSPIHEASRRGRTACVKLLCGARANVRQRDAVTNETPLHCAAVFGHVQVAKILIDAGAELNAQDLTGGLRAPYFACTRREGLLSIHSPDAMLLRRALAGTPLQHATTSLFITSLDARQQLIELLMKAGADPGIRDKMGLGPIDNPYVLKVRKDMTHREVCPRVPGSCSRMHSELARRTLAGTPAF